MPVSRWRRTKYSLDPRLKVVEKRKLALGKIDVDLKAVERMWEGLEPERKILEISKELGFSKAYARILIAGVKRKKLYE